MSKKSIEGIFGFSYHRRNPRYLGWDGTQRLKDIFTKYFGVESIYFDDDGVQKDLVQIYGVKYFVGAIKRALFATLESPIKQDVVLILMGAQGIRKSSALEALALKKLLVFR